MGISLPAVGQTEGPLVTVATGDPLQGCTADNVQQQEQAGSVLYPATAIEPWIVVDPSDPRRLLVGHQQDRWSDGGSRALLGNLSIDGGRTWSLTVPTEVTKCVGGPWTRASDPWVSFSPNGTAYFFSLTLNPDPNAFFGASSGAMLVSRSRDHGQTWGEPITLKQDGADALNDKNSITADPTESHFAYAVWDRLAIVSANAQIAPAATSMLGDGVLRARQHVQQRRAAKVQSALAPAQATPDTRGPTWFARTVDGGEHWQDAHIIYDPGLNAQTINNIVVVLPKGDVLDFFTNITATGDVSIGYVRSTDRGKNFNPTPVFATDIQVVGTVTPDAQEPVRDAAILYSVAVNRKNGALYLVWQDCRFGANNCNSATPVDDIAFSQSLDGGLTWSKPVMINKTPQNLANPLRSQAFIPVVAVAGDGTIAVTYYDFRNDGPQAGVELTDDWILFCNPDEGEADCTKPGNWGHELRLSPSSFNMLNAPVAGGHFLGDYMGLTASSKHVWPIFGMATGVDIVSEFTRKITLPHGSDEVASE